MRGSLPALGSDRTRGLAGHDAAAFRSRGGELAGWIRRVLRSTLGRASR
jgi:hypothetical protein